MSRKQAIKEVGRMKAVNQLLSIELAEKYAEIDRLKEDRSIAMRKAIRHLTEENRLRKALEEISETPLFPQVIKIASEALEPNEG